MRPQTVIRCLSLLLSYAYVSGCTSAGSPEGTADTAGAIINGNVVTADGIGTPLISFPAGICSSTLLSDHAVLTAHHCLTNEVVTQGGTPVTASSVTATLLNGANATGARVFLHPSVDIAVLELSTPLEPNPSGIAASLYTGSQQALLGKTLYCQGWGRNTFVSGQGTLRSASLTVSDFDADGYVLDPNGSGQIDWSGDSGSSCFILQNGRYAITGVQSTCTYNGTLNVPGGTVTS